MTLPITVSDHAIIRWLERVEGCDLDWVREDLRKSGRFADSDTQVLTYLRDKVGLDIADIEARILTPVVRAGIAAGSRTIRVGNVCLEIADGCMVTTVQLNAYRIANIGRASRKAEIAYNNKTKTQRARQ